MIVNLSINNRETPPKSVNEILPVVKNNANTDDHNSDLIKIGYLDTIANKYLL